MRTILRAEIEAYIDTEEYLETKENQKSRKRRWGRAVEVSKCQYERQG